MHDVRTCPAREWEYFSCTLKGHTSKLCMTKNKNTKESIDMVNVLSLNFEGSPLVIKIKINNCIISFELSVMSILIFNMYLKNTCRNKK